MKVKLTDEFVAKGKCPRCNYAEARWWKLIGLSSDGHTEQFHYWFECPNCKNRGAVERNKFAYNLLKNKKWVYSKRYMAYKQNGKLF